MRFCTLQQYKREFLSVIKFISIYCITLYYYLWQSWQEETSSTTFFFLVLENSWMRSFQTFIRSMNKKPLLYLFTRGWKWNWRFVLSPTHKLSRSFIYRIIEGMPKNSYAFKDSLTVAKRNEAVWLLFSDIIILRKARLFPRDEDKKDNCLGGWICPKSDKDLLSDCKKFVSWYSNLYLASLVKRQFRLLKIPFFKPYFYTSTWKYTY